MHLRDILTLQRTAIGVTAGSKKRALEVLGNMAAEDEAELNPAEVFESLIARERLGSTGIGHGIAIPHGRLKNSERAIGALIHLAEPIDYDAIDDEPVDLLFALLVPEHATEEHLEILAQLARLFSDADCRKRLREAPSPAALYELMVRSDPAEAHEQGDPGQRPG